MTFRNSASLMIPYTHKTHPRSRSIKIKVEANGQVVVVTPKRFSQRAIDHFIDQNQTWIKNTLAKVKQKAAFGETDQEVYVFGKKYTKNITSKSSLSRGVSIRQQELIINLPTASLTRSNSQAQSYLQRFLKNTAQQYIVPRTHQLAKVMQLSFGNITLRQQKTRWGSCSSQGNLNFNWRLIHAPTTVIDYVIIHELAHREHMNHSPAFWQLVAKHDPAHKLHRGWLKRHGMNVG